MKLHMLGNYMTVCCLVGSGDFASLVTRSVTKHADNSFFAGEPTGDGSM